MMIDESLPNRWLHRRGFKHSRLFLLFIGFFFGHFLSLAYKSTLLSTLVTIRYEKTLDTIEDLDKSGLGLLIGVGTVLDWLVASDPRPAVKRINTRRELVPFEGTIRKEDNDRYIATKSMLCWRPFPSFHIFQGHCRGNMCSDTTN